jgi:ankyrin repeat protein
VQLLKIIKDEMLNISETDEKKWTGLQWAVVNGHAEIVKILLKKEESKGHSRNISIDSNVLQQINEEYKDKNKNEVDDRFKKPLNPSSYGKYNPLHWAAYKGNIIITSILIMNGYNPLEMDMYGNTALHQAAASNSLEVFKIFMGLGIDLEVKNARNHVASDLTSNKDIKCIITHTISVKECKLCNKHFDFFTRRYFCGIKNEVVCKNCCIIDYYYENANSKDKDIVQCRCKTCANIITDTENNLRVAINSKVLNDITDIVNNIKLNKTAVCPKLLNEANCDIDRLEREKKILEHLNNLKVVENHKTIEKSVYVLEQMVQTAKDSNVELDVRVIERVLVEKNRLIAEKELRKLLSNLTVSMSSDENLENLGQKIEYSRNFGVEEKYILQGEELKKKIGTNLTAKKLLGLFLLYPFREYPKIEPIDPKKKSKIKFIYILDKEKPKPVKKKKKEPAFIIPEWAKELKSLIEKVIKIY